MTAYRDCLLAQSPIMRPYLTFLGADGRVELSVATFTNGADKVANALLNEFACDAGATIAVHLPWHWQRCVWSAGAWMIGGVVEPFGPVLSADVIAADPITARNLADEFPTARDRIVTVSLHPLGLGTSEDVAPGTHDGTALVRMQPDTFLGDPTASGAEAFRLDDVTLSQDEIRNHHLWEQVPNGARARVTEGGPIASWLAPVWLPVVRQAHVVMTTAGVDDAAEGITHTWTDLVDG
jgi:uncharacterized protein (TIGR03089 family)